MVGMGSEIYVFTEVHEVTTWTTTYQCQLASFTADSFKWINIIMVQLLLYHTLLIESNAIVIDIYKKMRCLLCNVYSTIAKGFVAVIIWYLLSKCDVRFHFFLSVTLFIYFLNFSVSQYDYSCAKCEGRDLNCIINDHCVLCK